MTSTKGLARTAGLLYLIVALSGGFSELFARTSVKVPGDAAATADNIRSSATLFRIAFATDLINTTCFLVVGLILHTLLKRVNSALALAMLVFNAVAVAIMSLNMLNHAGAYLAATSPEWTTTFGAATADGLALILLELHSYGYLIAQIFFGLFLLPLGYLIYVSGRFPRWLGVLVMIGCLSYLINLVVRFAFGDAGDDLTPIVTLPAAIGELSLVFWLLVKGIRPEPSSTVASGTPVATPA